MAAARPALPAPRPSVLVILADDLGVGDLPSYSPTTAPVPMPTLNRLAATGVRFTDFHTTPVCAPSRYTLLTGNYPHRGRSWMGTWNLGGASQMIDGQLTLAQQLANAGYRTAMFGKLGIGATSGSPPSRGVCEYACATRWILSNESNHHLGHGPSSLGFGHSFISVAGIQMPPYAFWENDELVGDARDATCWPHGAHSNSNGVSFTGLQYIDNKFHDCASAGQNNAKVVNGMPYWASNNYDINITTRRASAAASRACLRRLGHRWCLCARRAVRFLEQQHAARRIDGRPFFVHFCTAAVHFPHTPPTAAFGHPVARTSAAPFSDMRRSLDLTVAELLGKLKELGEMRPPHAVRLAVGRHAAPLVRA